MAYTTPTTRGAVVISTSNWNTDIVDNVKWLAGESSGGSPRCRVYNSAAFSVANNTLTAVTFDTENYDYGGCHSTSSNTSRLTVPSGGGGLYHIGGCAVFAANATGIREVRILLNGTTILARSGSTSLSASGDHPLAIETDYRLAAADYVELVVYQTSGGNLNVQQSGMASPSFYFRWVGI